MVTLSKTETISQQKNTYYYFQSYFLSVYVVSLFVKDAPSKGLAGNINLLARKLELGTDG